MIEQLIAEATECDFKVALETKNGALYEECVNSLNLATTIPTLIPSCVIFPSITFIFVLLLFFYFC